MSGETESIVVAALADLHVTDAGDPSYRDLFSEISAKADVLALAGDLTDLGKPRQAERLAADLRSCSIPVSSVEGASITTIEGLAAGGVLNAVQQAWLDHQVPQCGYCQSGMIMAVSALLAERPHATDADIDETITNICRCGTFARIRKAIHGLTEPGGA